MSKNKTRSDKKFGIKVWVTHQDKDIFRGHCFQYHLSMMFVGEKYLIKCLEEMDDLQLESIIESKLDKFNMINSKRDGYEVLGIRLTNQYWQKLAYFAVRYKTSIAKISSCLFDYCLGAFELRGIEEQYGLTFNVNKKKMYQGRSHGDGRVSDY